MAWTAGSAAAVVVVPGVAVGEAPFCAATGPMRGTDGTVVGAAAAIGGLAGGVKLVVTKRSTAKPISALNRATPINEAAMLQRRGCRSGCTTGGGGGGALSSSGRQSEGLLGNMGMLLAPLLQSLCQRY